MYITILLMILLSTSVSYADISKTRTFPSGIKVTFQVPEYVEKANEKKAEEAKTFRWEWQRKRYEKQLAQALAKQAKATNDTPPKMVTYDRFIRIINTIPSPEYVSINFYDSDDKVIFQQKVTNTPKPTPQNIFFMDRVSGRNYQGHLDQYYIPEKASYFQIVVYNSQNKPIRTIEHPDFQDDNKILVSQFKRLAAGRKIMYQIEITGSGAKSLVRAGGFYFVN